MTATTVPYVRPDVRLDVRADVPLPGIDDGPVEARMPDATGPGSTPGQVLAAASAVLAAVAVFASFVLVPLLTMLQQWGARTPVAVGGAAGLSLAGIAVVTGLLRRTTGVQRFLPPRHARLGAGVAHPVPAPVADLPPVAVPSAAAPAFASAPTAPLPVLRAIPGAATAERSPYPPRRSLRSA